MDRRSKVEDTAGLDFPSWAIVLTCAAGILVVVTCSIICIRVCYCMRRKRAPPQERPVTQFQPLGKKYKQMLHDRSYMVRPTDSTDSPATNGTIRKTVIQPPGGNKTPDDSLQSHDASFAYASHDSSFADTSHDASFADTSHDSSSGDTSGDALLMDKSHDASFTGGRKVKRQSSHLGRIQIHLTYYVSRQLLSVTVISAKDLPVTESYCTLMLLPEAGDKKLTSQTVKKTQHPAWNETLEFHMSQSELPGQMLYVYILSRNVLNQDEFIGVARFPLAIYPDLAKHGETLVQDLEQCKRYVSPLGELLLSLHYSPGPEKLILNVLKAKQLPPMDLNHYSDPYVKIWRIFDGMKQEKRKTKIIKKNLNPVFNESFTFDVSQSNIHSTSLLICVVDWDKILADDVIGYILLGSGKGCGERETRHWREMCQTLKKPTAHWHQIQRHAPIVKASE